MVYDAVVSAGGVVGSYGLNEVAAVLLLMLLTKSTTSKFVSNFFPQTRLTDVGVTGIS